MQNIQNHNELLVALKPNQKSYLLLYKAGSEASECSLANLKKAAEKLSSINVLLADVTHVKDIHENYQVKTVPSLLIFEGEKFSNVIKGCHDPVYYISLFEESLFSASMKEGEVPQKRVTVYSTPSCSWCNTLKAYFKTHNIRFTDIDVSKNQQAAEQMVRKSGQQGVPQTDINGQIIVGFDKAKINRLLGIQSNN
ncbi:MAG: glutaredoxin domain-containing protein [Bacteroidales bacterium]|nr:glutaredoxin domain-containing protein [Bacteroidales bacterium]